MKNPEFECELFNLPKDEAIRNFTKFDMVKVIGRHLYISRLQKGFKSSLQTFMYDDYEFTYTFDIPYKNEFVDIKKGKRKINVRITYSRFNGVTPQTCYAHFTCFQKLVTSMAFKKLWVQQTPVVLWIISTLVGIVYFFLKSCC